MFNRTLVVAAATLALLIPFAGQAAAQPGPPGPPGQFGPPAPPPRLPLFEADLTVEQQAQVRAAMDAQRTMVDPILMRLRETDAQLRTLVLAEAPDAAAIAAARELGSRLQQQVYRLQVDLDVKLAAMLTPEQRAKLLALPDPSQAGPRRPGRTPSSTNR